MFLADCSFCTEIYTWPYSDRIHIPHQIHPTALMFLLTDLVLIVHVIPLDLGSAFKEAVSHFFFKRFLFI